MHILHDESLLKRNSLRLQSRASAFVRVSSDEQVAEACRWAVAHELPLVPMGEGSNIVLAGDLEAMVLCQEARGIEMLDESQGSVTLRASAGENWHELVCWTLQQGLFGLENLALIPGTVGAAPIQNIGAYGVELDSVLEAVHGYYVNDGSALSLSRTECELAYRDSVFKQALRDAVIITAVDLRLSRQANPRADYPALASELEKSGIIAATPRQVFDAVVSIRRSKLPDPAVEPNAGSFFKNPLLPRSQAQALIERFPGLPAYPAPNGKMKLAAAWLIEYCGWKGFREDDIGIHPQHALVVVNYGNESGARLLSLASEVAATVEDTFGVELAIEPRVYA